MQISPDFNPELLAPCGVYWGACSAYLNKKKPCLGCRTPIKAQKRKSCMNCAKRRCAFEQGHKWCFQCAKFPCARIKSLNKTYVKNYGIDLIQNGLAAGIDMAAFLLALQGALTCEACGGRIDQHKAICSSCGGLKA